MRCADYIAVALITLAASFAAAQTMQVTAPHFAKNPTIDGHVSPDEQNGAARLNLTVVGALEKPKYATTAYLFVNDGGVYVGFVCSEPAIASLVQKATKDNGPVFEDDSVQLFLAPDREGTNNNYYHFVVNSGGVRYSNRMQDDTPVDGWTAGASKGTNTWEAEIFVPYSSMNVLPELPYWRMNIARERPARSATEKAETTAWINPGASLHNYKRFGFLQFRQSPVATGAAAATSGSSASTSTTIITTSTGHVMASQPSVAGVPAAAAVLTTQTQPMQILPR
jgi:hypothetical protein